MIKVIFFILLGIQVLSAKEILTLRFDNRVTWQQIFDSGFRPKHLEGLEDHKCICQNQNLWLQFKDRDLKFKLDEGRVQFGFFHDDFLQMVWHQGAEPLTLDEGKHRADEFRKLFDGYIIQEITMPRLIDPSGLVDAGNDENNIKVRVGEYLIWYGFDNSMGKVKPIIPHFYIVWNFPGRPDVRLKDSDDIVRPPKGYEWYSLDPKVNTPDPGSSEEAATNLQPNMFEDKESNLPRADKKSKLPVDTTIVTTNTPWKWWLGFLIIGIVVLAKYRRNIYK
jgi:hypothetical protein